MRFPLAASTPALIRTQEPVSGIVRASLDFDQVYERHFPFVWRVLRTFGLSAATAEDAAQDVFIVVHRRLSEFEGRSDIRTWLFQVAKWVYAHERRRLRTKPEHGPVDEGLPDRADGPFEAIARGEAVLLLERILDRMEPEKRMAFLLMDVEELKASEVAELLEVNVNTVYSRLRLARIQFRRLVRENTQEESRP